MSDKILIFGGTTEGRILAEFCSSSDIPAVVSVTTGYGADLVSNLKNIEVITGKLDENQITEYISKNKFSLIIDATHPYAINATDNIKKSCKTCNAKYIRLLREKSETLGKSFENINDVIDYLNQDNRNILLTTGSKTLPEFLKVNNFYNRIAVRVLPSENILEYCTGLGFDRNKIICEKGSFSVEDNIKHIKKFKSEILVTKESGKTGGYEEKIKASKICGIESITIKRPFENGTDIETVKNILEKKYGEK